ncbi:MAG TPA: hypothetical protein PKE69_06990 [Pyrinomonadaceae bacterium]|nr:hypothetical protein [Pyrinomonadaceae bacterium]
MNKLFNFRFLAVFLAAIFIFGATSQDSFAQTKKKPVIKKKPTVKKPVPTKPVIKLYNVPVGQRMRVRINEEISSKTAKVGDTFTNNVTEPVYSDSGVIVIPAGSTIIGRVDSVVPAKKGGNPGAIEVSFIEVKLPNGTKRAINGSLTDLNAEDAKSDNESTASGDKMKNRKIIFIGGGGAGGAVIGGMVGGAKGALIGAGVGALGGFLGEKFTKGEEAVVKSGTEFGVVLNQAISMAKWTEPVN